MLRVKVPPYERNQFRVQVSSQEVQTVGVRTLQEKAEVEPGRWVSTSSHQNVSESFKLDAPVDVRAMVMHPDGEYLVYTLPKLGAIHAISKNDPSEQNVRRAEAELNRALDFPNSLPQPTLAHNQNAKGPLPKA